LPTCKVIRRKIKFATNNQASHALVVETNRTIEVEATTSVVCKLLKVRWSFALIYHGKREEVDKWKKLVRLKSTVTIQLTRTPDRK
jgi:hypothetical protein